MDQEQRPKAVIVTDLYGQSADYDVIVALCEKHDVIVIEDAAEALGSEYKEKKCGTFGRMGVLSFNGNKIITTSGGGMLVSNNEDVVKKARFLATQAREAEIHYEHKELGYNYRMSNLLAAVGRGQLQVLNNRVKARRHIFQRYFKALSEIYGFYFMPEAPNSRSNRWLTTLTVDSKKTGITRTQIIEALEKCFLEDNKALIEEEINGREITVGVIVYKNKIIALPPTEIRSHNSFFDFNAKYKGESDEITPANITKEDETIIKNLAIKIFKKLKLKGFTRSDFILTDDKFYFLEINTVPGLTKESILPQQAQEAGISLKNLFKSVIE